MPETAVKRDGPGFRRLCCAAAVVLALAGCDELGSLAGGDPEAEAALAAAAAAMEGQVGETAGDADPAAEEETAEEATPEDDAAQEAEAVEETGAPEAEEAAPKPPDRNAAAKAACERGGGFFSATSGGKAGYCARYTRDGNRSCEASSACEGYCLARSRTCAPITPLIGCHQVLSDRGVEERTCLN